MSTSPEVEHLKRAAEAVKKAIVNEKSKEPEPEQDTEAEEEAPKRRETY